MINETTTTTLTSSPRRAMVTTHTRAEYRGQRSVGLKARIETDAR